MGAAGAGIEIRGTTQIVGVWGWPVRHSASPPMHNAAFAALGMDWAYVPFAVAPERIGEAVAGIRALGLRGVNVTVPLKELVLPFLDALTPRAARLGAVNTILNEEGYLTGDSTDGRGFLAALAESDALPPPGSRAIVLGAGGSARAVIAALRESGVSVTVANRSLERAHELAARFHSASDGPLIEVISLEEAALGRALGREGAVLLVNTTSVGMHPRDAEMPPLPLETLHPDLFVSDLIYNPPQTRLLAAAEARGCRTQNGLSMLVWQ
ncbi:MAG: shikimate dehydrogenase, partial [Cytophagales bacterium]|nr:shikimate dehydrogenase [Armatimonadota bacterium]